MKNDVFGMEYYDASDGCKARYVRMDNCLPPIVDELRGYSSPTKSDGGPSSYYDFEPEWVTWNDLLESKARQWGAYALHLKDVGKLFMRFGCKDGTSNAYDARKLVYSGLRLLGMIEGRGAMRVELLKLLDDPQFK